MGIRSDVVVATDKANADKILAVAKEVDVEPDHIINLPNEDDLVILKWDYIKWYHFLDEDIVKLHKAISELDYYDYMILDDEGTYTYYGSSDSAPCILGIGLTYWDNKEKRNVLL